MATPIANVFTLDEMLAQAGEAAAGTKGGWDLRCVRSEQCLSYLAWNSDTREGVFVDPKEEDLPAYLEWAKNLAEIRWLAVIDTHTHADHVSAAEALGAALGAPVVMGLESECTRVQVRKGDGEELSARAGAIRFWATPGHTHDALTVAWGPYLFTGDTVLYGDTGRDDLPSGSPEAHYASLVALRNYADPEAIVLPGHDHRGARASRWKRQIETNASLTQSREDFVRESRAFSAPPPGRLAEALARNTR